MFTFRLFRFAIVTLAVCFTPEAIAQPGGGGMCGGRMGSSGGMMGGMTARMGSTMMGQGRQGTNQRGGNGFSGMNGLNGLMQLSLNQMGQGQRQGAGGNRRMRQQNTMAQPTPAQFVQAAMRFDRNDDQQLDQQELNLVASAVISELQSRRISPRQSRTRRAQPSNTSTSSMEETFVNRAMKFDRDNNGTLSSSETTRMAAALIRSLS